MQHFQPILIAIGFLAIVGVLAHGFLLSRKSKRVLRTLQEMETTEFDELTTESNDSISETAVNRDTDAMDFSMVPVDENQVTEEVKFIADEVDNDPASVSTSNVDNSDVIKVGSKPALKVEKETKVEANNEAEPSATSAKAESPNKEVKITQPTDIFVFNVVRRENSRLGGHELLQFFLTSGFRFGAMNIFHRHENSDGTGEVLFSIANMMAPGTFDLDLMEQFNSQGISFFLTAPNPKISIKKSFELMLRAVEQLADEFDCDVLNEHREPLTEKQFIEYRNKLQQYP